ncbi:uncharacterized protein LOC144097482 [Amblyomma americanum]
MSSVPEKERPQAPPPPGADSEDYMAPSTSSFVVTAEPSSAPERKAVGKPTDIRTPDEAAATADTSDSEAAIAVASAAMPPVDDGFGEFPQQLVEEQPQLLNGAFYLLSDPSAAPRFYEGHQGLNDHYPEIMRRNPYYPNWFRPASPRERLPPLANPQGYRLPRAD